ncbi:uncharacterized protein ACOB8E_000460 [Sarcophilus harrisii]
MPGVERDIGESRVPTGPQGAERWGWLAGLRLQPGIRLLSVLRERGSSPALTLPEVFGAFARRVGNGDKPCLPQRRKHAITSQDSAWSSFKLSAVVTCNLRIYACLGEPDTELKCLPISSVLSLSPSHHNMMEKTVVCRIILNLKGLTNVPFIPGYPEDLDTGLADHESQR